MFLKHAILIYGLLRLSDYPVASNFFSFFSSSIRIGTQNLSSSHSDEFVQVLEVERNFKHPRYDGVASYFDVGLLETKPVTFSPVK